MNYAMRLARVFEGTRFSSIPNQDDRYPILELGERNIREYEALNDERRAIIEGLLSEILAAGIQPMAIEKFGCADRSAVESMLNDNIDFRLSMEKLGLDKQLRKELTNLGLNEEDARMLQEKIMSDYAVEFVQLIADLVDRWRLFHIAQTEPVAKVLADMMKEVGA